MFSEVPTFNPILPNGVSAFIEAVSRQLVELGHEVHVFEQQQFLGQEKTVEVQEDITIHRVFSLPLSHYQDFRVPFAFGSIFKGVKLKFDVIHAHGPILGVFATVLAKKQNCIKVVHYHTPGEHYRKYIPRVFAPFRTNFFIEWFEGLVYNSFDLILAPAHEIRRRLIQRGFKEDRLFVLPNCVDLKATHNRIRKNRVQYLQNYYKLSGKKVVLFVGRMSPEKKIPDIINLVPRVVKEEPDTHFLFVGKGPYLNAYKKLALQVAPHDITFTGYVNDSDLANLMQFCCLGLIFADKAQVFDITLLELWSNRLAVCARRAGGMGDVITHAENAMLFTKQSEALDQILTLLQDDKKRLALGKKGFETAQKKYSVEAVTKQLLGYYAFTARELHFSDKGTLSYLLHWMKIRK
jgi:glycosyltransferase involved in cell wall biosynthesis